MPYNHQMDPSLDMNRRAMVRDERIRLVNTFCESVDHRTMEKMEETFLLALNDWSTHMLRSYGNGRTQLKEVRDIIERARKIRDGGGRVKVRIFLDDDERSSAMRQCRSKKHRIKTKLDRGTLETFYFCVRCNTEMRIGKKANVP